MLMRSFNILFICILFIILTSYSVANSKQLSKSPFIPDDILNKYDDLPKEYKSKICGFNNYKPKKNSTINVTNIGGPLNHLENNWKFIETEGGTEISFDIDFEIENKFLNVLMSKSFEFGLNKIADAFQKRAEDLYRSVDN